MGTTTGMSSTNSDPYTGLNWWVDINGVHVAGFLECSPIIIELETLEVKEGGVNGNSKFLPVRVKHSNITLKRPIDSSADLLNWFQLQPTNAWVKKMDVSIILYNSQMQQLRRWDLRKAYPVKWTGPDLKANSGAMAVESLEIAYEGLLPSSVVSGPNESDNWTNEGNASSSASVEVT
jgi:phage tail-like protein